MQIPETSAPASTGRLKRSIIWLFIILVSLTVAVGGWEIYHRNAFSSSFGVYVPWGMDLPWWTDNGERELMQTYVRTRLTTFHESVENIKRRPCSDAPCMQYQLAQFQAAKKALDNAESAASHYSFNTNIGPTSAAR